jgi:hypothetical protein
MSQPFIEEVETDGLVSQYSGVDTTTRHELLQQVYTVQVCLALGSPEKKL